MLSSRYVRTAGPTAATEPAHTVGGNATCPAEPMAGGHAARAMPTMPSRNAHAASAGASAPSGSPRQAKVPTSATAAIGGQRRHAQSADVNGHATVSEAEGRHAAPVGRDPDDHVLPAGESRRSTRIGRWGLSAAAATRKSSEQPRSARYAGKVGRSSQAVTTEAGPVVPASVMNSDGPATNAERPLTRTSTTDAPAAR
jgi:hypothetical protein